MTILWKNPVKSVRLVGALFEKVFKVYRHLRKYERGQQQLDVTIITVNITKLKILTSLIPLYDPLAIKKLRL